MACGSPRPIWYLRDAVALRRPRRVCNPMWQLKTERPAEPRPGHQEGRTVPLEFRAIHFSFEFPQMLPVLSRKRRHHHQGGCAQRPAGPTQTSSFVSAELLCHRQDSQCFCTSLQAPKFSVCNPAQALAGFVASSSFRCVVHLRVQLWVCSFPSTAFLLSLTHAYSRLRWSAE